MSGTSLLDMSGFEEERVTLSPVRDNDDVFLIRVPKGYDIEKLNGIGEYSPPGTVQIEAKEGKQGIVSVVELGAFGGKNLNVNLLINSGNDKVIAGPYIKQSLSVSRSVHLNPSFPTKTLNCGDHSQILMPSGLKPRFTPFGAGHPVHVELKKRKKHKKKKRERVGAADTSIHDMYSSISGSDASSTKHHLYAEKRPSSSKPNINGISMRSKMAVSGLSPSTRDTTKRPKKKKKRKSNPIDFMADLNDSHAYLNSSNCLEPSEEEGESSVNANHKKKRKSDPIKQDSDFSYQSSKMSSYSSEEPSVNSINPPHGKKKKKKKSEVDDRVFHDNSSTNFLLSNSIEDTSFQEENTRINDKERKKGHKRKLSSGYQSLDSSVILDESPSVNVSPSEKRHKKKKRRKEHDK